MYIDRLHYIMLLATLTCYYTEFECVEGYTKCKDKKQCIKETYWCDAFKDCKDFSDEGDHCAGMLEDIKS